MALLDNIEYSPGEPIQDMYDKINAAIDAINNVLGGGTQYQVVRKASATDFDYEKIKALSIDSSTDQLQVKILEIGNWNMDTSGNPAVAPVHGVNDPVNNIMHISAMIRNDAASTLIPLDRAVDSTDGTVSGGITVNATNLTLFRVDAGVFDNASYDSIGGFNRGFVIIFYKE